MATTQTRRSRSSSSSKKRSSSAKKSSARRGSANNNGGTQYRRAAEDALQQLDWAIGYLHGIGKTNISRALAQNRSYIRRNLMGQPDPGVPTQETDET
jgi:hypothetical protein